MYICALNNTKFIIISSMNYSHQFFYTIFLSLIFACTALGQGTKNKKREFLLQAGTKILLADVHRSKELLGQEDDYTKGLTRFDLMSKLQKLDTNLTAKDYLAFAPSQALDWSNSEERKMAKMIALVAQRLANLGIKLSLPPVVEFVKTTGREEGGAAYTRSNYVVFSKSMLDADQLDGLIAHELFHILSRYNPDLKEKIYRLHGFLKCNEIPLPAEIAQFKISNPDAPYNDYFIKLKHNNHNIEAAIVIYSETAYEGGVFFSYLKKSLLVLSGKEEKKPKYVNGKPVLLDFREVGNLYEQLGKNSEYNIHVEEIAADHFDMLLREVKDLPNPEIISNMKLLLKEQL
ncbi:MAG: hypothetical protein EAZ57_02540 [Cytophagales bacterium]|nr:MAG: hypothetical protein EAZ67_03005 [Cytophagales bacterium]TAF61643.1 MAG: hypothetical protein EAZ57_02540 [Cytophagales bacterium]